MELARSGRADPSDAMRLWTVRELPGHAAQSRGSTQLPAENSLAPDAHGVEASFQAKLAGLRRASDRRRGGRHPGLAE
jgi:hypothetical protein